MQEAYEVKLDNFEGPLDLLLHLIKQYEIDIYEIPMAELTEQYMQYIHTMQKLELNVASEYLVMASTLVAIKSQMLIPSEEITDDSEDYQADPREELYEKIIEYRKYKEVAEKLKEKEDDERHTYTRPPINLNEILTEKPTVVQGELSVYDMLGALGKMFERKKWNHPLDSTISRAEISIDERMEDVLKIVKESKDGIRFDELFPHPSRSHIVITFLSILELMKANQIICKQRKHFDTLYLYAMEE